MEEGLAIIYLWCPRTSEGAAALVKWLRQHDHPVAQLREWESGIQSGLVVNWGSESLARLRPASSSALRLLNQNPCLDKFEQLQRLERGGLNIPPYSRTPRRGWLARWSGHYEANDLREAPSRGDYYVQWLDIIEERRVHSFLGTSICAQIKRATRPPTHPWIRCTQTGWDWFAHDATPDLRRTAHQACSSGGYDFGAVDLGITRAGDIVVLEVNTAPGLDGDLYATRRYGEAIVEEHRDLPQMPRSR